MLSQASINSLGTFKYYEYNDTESAPTEIGPMAGDWSSYKMLGSDSYTADEIHNNMRLIYDKICEEEDNSIADETVIQRQPGLSIFMLDNIYTTSEDFSYTIPNGEFMVESVILPKGKSVELTGYFIPSKSGVYQFSSSSKSMDSWIGDVAMYEYTEFNRTINQIQLNKNYYYAVRFQTKNEGETNLALTISVTCNGEVVTTPQFVTLFKNEQRYERKLLYYGLIGAPGNKYYCYYDADENYDIIINSKYKTELEMTAVLPSDSAPISKNSSINDGQQTLLESSTSVFDVNVQSASYRTNPTYENVTATRTMIDWKNAYENYTFTGTRLVNVRRGRRIVKVPQQYTEPRRRRKNPLPRYTQTYTYRRRIPPRTVNVTGEVNNAIGRTIQPSDVTSARDGTLTIRTTNTVRPGTAKSISMNDAGDIIATYNNTTNVVLFPASGQNCSSKMIKINNDGTVTGCNGIWHNPMSPYMKSTAIANTIWKGQGVSPHVIAGTPLTTIISEDSRFKLELSPDSKLQFTYCVKPYYELGKNKFSGNIKQALYLYRPTYNRLSGKMYIETPGNQLIQVKSNDDTLQFSSFSNVEGGYPLVPSEYETIKEPTTSAKCRELCQNERRCGNYVTYGESGCMLDGSYNNKPNFSRSSKISKPNIYIKKYKMNAESGPVAFAKTDIGNFSDYTIINDEDKLPMKPIVVKDSAVVNAKSDYSDALYQLNELKTAEAFQGQDIPARFLNKLPDAPDVSVEEGRIDDLQMILFQQNVMYSLTSIAALTFLASAIVLSNK
jgi:hypothetical protein